MPQRVSVLLILLAFLVHLGSAPPVQAARDNTLGVNLSELVDYSDEDPFIDYMKMSREWFGQSDTEFDTNENAKIALDASGWVTSVRPKGGGRFTRVATIMMVGGDPHNNYADTYAILYDGKGTMTFGGASVVSESAGRTVVTVTDSAGFFVLRITSTDSRDYLRNIRVVKTSQERNFLRGAIFNPVWLAKLAPFGVIRFMDWMRTNDSSAGTWGSRPLESTFDTWFWSRATSSEGAHIIYDKTLLDGSRSGFAIDIDHHGAIRDRALPPETELGKSFWRMQRPARLDGPKGRVTLLEDSPFYTRSLVETQIGVEPVTAFHESLSLTRFKTPWMQMMLPFRMPRWDRV